MRRRIAENSKPTGFRSFELLVKRVERCMETPSGFDEFMNDEKKVKNAQWRIRKAFLDGEGKDDVKTKDAWDDVLCRAEKIYNAIDAHRANAATNARVVATS
jgi:hypothetical protein